MAQTSKNSITLPDPGASAGSWGQVLNDAIESVDVLIDQHKVPSGGTSNQVLTKASSTNYDVAWTTVPGFGNTVDSLTGGNGVNVSATTGDVTLSVNASTLRSHLSIEANAKDDQTGAEIKSLYEAESDTNAFTDSEKTKLGTVESNAKDDQTGAEIKSLYEGESNTNAFTDAEKTLLGTIETNSKDDQTGAEIKSLYESESDTNAFTDAEKTKLSSINTATYTLDTDLTNVSTNDDSIASAKSIKTYVDSKPDQISELADVNLSSPQDNHLLAYDTATVAFENKSISTLLSFGITHQDIVKIDNPSGQISATGGDYVRFTANGVEPRTTTQVLSDLGVSDEIIATAIALG